MEDILPIIPAWIMLAVGFALLSLELITGTFIMLFFGLAFIVVGASGFFMTWFSGEVQLLVAMLLGGLLTFGLRRFFMRGTSQEDMPLETMQAGEAGQIVGHGGRLSVVYKGTTWTFKSVDGVQFSEGDEVMVESLKNNIAYVKKMT